MVYYDEVVLRVNGFELDAKLFGSINQSQLVG